MESLSHNHDVRPHWSRSWKETVDFAGARSWSRPLGNDEAAWYFDGEINGGIDVIMDVHFTLPSNQKDLFAEPSRMKRAWASVKRRHPLIASKIVEKTTNNIMFVVDERRMDTFLPGELQLGVLSSHEELAQVVEDSANGPRLLTSELLACLHIYATPWQEDEDTFHYHALITTSHAITDARACFLVLSTFFDEITVSGLALTPFEPLGKRLQLVPSVDDLTAGTQPSVARKRWRMAAAKIIFELQKGKRSGGHSLPNKNAPLYLPSISRIHRVRLSERVTSRIFQTCRENGITLGHAMNVLCQLAHASIFASSNVPPGDDTEARSREPMYFNGPYNIRPHLDKDWLDAGGDTQTMSIVSWYNVTLPFMPTPDRKMSSGRFFERCRSVQRQMDGHFKHPLVLELAYLAGVKRREERRQNRELWRDYTEGRTVMEEGRKVESGRVLANEVSTFGSLASILPTDYPRLAPVIRVLSALPIARPCPGTFYMTADGQNRRITFTTFWDSNAYDDTLILRWSEIVGAHAREYLGGQSLTKL